MKEPSQRVRDRLASKVSRFYTGERLGEGKSIGLFRRNSRCGDCQPAAGMDGAPNIARRHRRAAFLPL